MKSNDPTTDTGRIRLSWAQVMWAIATLVAILTSWADTRTQIALLRQESSMRYQEAERDREKIWKAIGDLYAGERGKDKK